MRGALQDVTLVIKKEVPNSLKFQLTQRKIWQNVCYCLESWTKELAEIQCSIIACLSSMTIDINAHHSSWISLE